MRKSIAIITLLLAVLTASAQQRIDMNRSFDVSGTAFIFSKADQITKSDYIPTKWNLKNNHVGGNNYLIFSAQNAKTGESLALQAFDENIGIQLRIGEDGKKTYVVYDNDFFHLMITEIDGGTAILYYLQPRKKP